MKILVSIISSKNHIDSRLKFIKETWLKDVEHFCIVSDYNDENSNTYMITEQSNYESNVEKNFKSFKFFKENFSDFDWYINLDDDTFLNYNNLKNLISTLSLDDISLYGRINRGTLPQDPSLNYCSGGAGYLFNRKTLDILENIDNNYHKSRFADANVGMFCRDKNIPLIDCELFNPREPEYYNFDIQNIKKSITFHYIFENKFHEIYEIINI